MPFAVDKMLEDANDDGLAMAQTEEEIRFVQRAARLGRPAMVWVTKDMGLQAAEAAAEYVVGMRELANLLDTMREFSETDDGDYASVIIGFPEGVVPDVCWEGHHVPFRGVYLSAIPQPMPTEGDDSFGITVAFTPLVLSSRGGFTGVIPVSPLFPEDTVPGVKEGGLFRSGTEDEGSIGEWDYVHVSERGVEALSPANMRQTRKLLDGTPLPDMIGRFTMAVMALMTEPGICTTTLVRAGRKDARPDAEGVLRVPEIRRVDLRPMKHVAVSHDATGRVYTHRWVVRGHWRQQWYATIEKHKKVFIPPYLKGPEGAPLLTSPKVYVWSR